MKYKVFKYPTKSEDEENEGGEMNIILAGDGDRPEVIAVVNTKEDLEKAIIFVQSQSWDFRLYFLWHFVGLVCKSV